VSEKARIEKHGAPFVLPGCHPSSLVGCFAPDQKTERKPVMGNGRFSKSGMFFVGFFSGILVIAAAAILLANYVMKHPQLVIGKVATVSVGRLIQQTAATAPREYIGKKQDEIAVTAQAFARAYSEQKVTPEDVQAIGVKVLSVLADQKITQQEIDEVLRMMQRYAGVTNAGEAKAPAAGEAIP
jgi:hypothetical protein